MQNWWSNLDGFEQLLWGLALPLTVLMAVLFLLAILGSKRKTTELIPDVLEEDQNQNRSGFFSLRNLIAGLAVFPWASLAMYTSGAYKSTSLIVGAGMALLAMLILGSFFYFFGRIVEQGTAQLQSALNSSAEVLKPIPAAGSGSGSVQIVIQGDLQNRSAMTLMDEELKEGEFVKVVDIHKDGTLVVKRV